MTETALPLTVESSRGDQATAYVPHWNASAVDYDAPWEIREDGSRCGADSMRTAAYLAAWHQMRQTMPREQWSVAACDAIAESVLRVVRDWAAAP